MSTIPRPYHDSFYPEREADLMRALRPHFQPDADDYQALTLEAYHAGWGLTEIGNAIERLKEERRGSP